MSDSAYNPTYREMLKVHVHHVKRLRAGSRTRYECLDCGKQLKLLSGIVVENPEAYIDSRNADYSGYLARLIEQGHACK